MLARYVEDDNLPAGQGLAGDEFLLRSGELCLRLYTYKPHAALCGRFQKIQDQIDLKCCEDLGIGVSRRLTGGGAIIMGRDQLGIAVAIPAVHELSQCPPREVLAVCSRCVISGLKNLSISASFTGKNDIECNAMKIAGTGLARNDDGSTLFHASLLVGLDRDLMAKVLKIPDGVAQKKITTITDETDNNIDTNKTRSAIKSGFEQEFGWELDARGFAGKELETIRKLDSVKYSSPDWINEIHDDFEDKHYACFA